jgi:hypothetical protein
MLIEQPRFKIISDKAEVEIGNGVLQKAIEDLSKGFWIRFPNSGRFDGYVAVVTRFLDDLFIVETDNGTLNYNTPLERYFRLGLSIARRKEVEKSNLEAFEMHASSNRPIEGKFLTINREQENLDEVDFWREYNLSSVSKKATNDLFEIQKEKLSANNPLFTTGWENHL